MFCSHVPVFLTRAALARLLFPSWFKSIGTILQKLFDRHEASSLRPVVLWVVVTLLAFTKFGTTKGSRLEAGAVELQTTSILALASFGRNGNIPKKPATPQSDGDIGSMLEV